MLCCALPIGRDRSRVIDDPIHGCVRNERGMQCISTVFVEARDNELTTGKPNGVTHTEVAEENALGIRSHLRHCIILHDGIAEYCRRTGAAIHRTPDATWRYS